MQNHARLSTSDAEVKVLLLKTGLGSPRWRAAALMGMDGKGDYNHTHTYL